jgi:hypothetical protein
MEEGDLRHIDRKLSRSFTATSAANVDAQRDFFQLKYASSALPTSTTFPPHAVSTASAASAASSASAILVVETGLCMSPQQ